jgi:hypothetical protein
MCHEPRWNSCVRGAGKSSSMDLHSRTVTVRGLISGPIARTDIRGQSSGGGDVDMDEEERARADGCLERMVEASNDLLDIEELEPDGLRAFARATKHVATAYREQLGEEQSDEVDA